MKINLIILFILCSKFVFAQSGIFNFNVPQSIYIAGESIDFQLTSNQEKSVFVYVVLRNTDLSKVKIDYIKIGKGITRASILLPENLASQTYLLSAYILNSTYEIAQEYTYAIHLSDGKNTNFKMFANQKPTNNQTSSDVVKRRGSLDAMSTEFSYSIKTAYEFAKSYTHYVSDFKNIDTTFRLFFRLKEQKNDLQNLIFFNTDTKSTARLNSNGKNLLSLPFNEASQDQSYKIIDIKTIKEFEGLTTYTQSTENQNSLVSFDAEKINLLYKESLNRVKLNKYFETNSLQKFNPLPVKIKADNEYNIADYNQFEGLELFLKEVVLPQKIENEDEEKSIFLLTGIEKKWNTTKATVVIDGNIIEDHNAVLNYKWDELKSLKLFRKIETIRTYYGALARNGVFEITTKNGDTNPQRKFPLVLQEILPKQSQLDEKLYSNPLLFFTSDQKYHNDCIGIFSAYDSEGKYLNTYEVK